MKLLREATKKKEKKIYNSCELSPKMENPPSPNISQQQSLASSPTVRLCVRASVSNMESDVYIHLRKSFEGMLAF